MPADLRLSIVNPLAGTQSVLTKNEQILLGRCGYILGLLINSKAKTGGQALLALHQLRNHAAPGGDIHTACVADSLAAGLQEFEEQLLSATLTGKREVTKPAKAGRLINRGKGNAPKKAPKRG